MKKLGILGLLLSTMLFAEGVSPTLIGGTPAPAGEWPASVYASMGGARCTATVIGPRVLAIAAHCVSNGGSASFKAGGNSYTAVCTHSSDYRGNSTADYTLCEIDREVTGIKYESLLVDEEKLKVGMTVKLTGYGCIQPGGGGGNDGIYRIGNAKITRLPSGNNNDVVTNASPAALCFGDSGGPAVLIEDDGSRWVFGVNSRGNIASVSYLSAWYTTQGKRFLNAWVAREGHSICGMHPDVPNCRNDKEPEGPQLFSVANAAAQCDFTVQPGELKGENIKAAFEAAGYTVK
jgi:hypothetical protein